MWESDNWFGFGFGLCLGVLLGAFLATIIWTTGGYISEAKKLKEKCEIELPRNVSCHMEFVKPNQTIGDKNV